MLAMLGVDLLQNVVDQQRNVFLMIPQRRQMDVKHIQPEIQILAQLSLPHGMFRILVRGRQHPHIHGRFRFAPQTPHFAIFQYAQQLGLRRRGHFADFIEQQRPAVGQLEAPDAALRRAGKRAALVSENFAFHQRFGNRRAIDGDERSRRARRKLMNRARDNLFPRSRLAGDQHRCRARRGHFHDTHHFLHRFRAAHQIAQPPRFAQLPLQDCQLPSVARFTQRSVQQGAQHWRFQRFLDVPEGARFDRRHCAFFASFSGDDDGRNFVQIRS